MKITFLPENEYVEKFVPAPKPASQYIPDWYKKTPRMTDKDMQITDDHKVVGAGLKACMPFIDALTTGYIQESWGEIFIKKDEKNFRYAQSLEPQLIGHREKKSVAIASVYTPIEFVWHTRWRPRLPKGYSLLITHPLNRLDLPFTTMTGVVDSDVFFHTTDGQIPFFIHDSFEGTIPAGTPLFQMIPIKRDAWYSATEKFNYEETEKRKRLRHSEFWGVYKNHFRQKKVYR